MFFPIGAEEWSKALGQIRRLRHRRNWRRIGSSDAYWTATFLAALVETVDSLLLDEPLQAYQLSEQGIVVAERMRPEDCPGSSEIGKCSLQAWIQAVHGSSCRACERYSEAEGVFEQATWITTTKVVLPWAAAEVDRRYAVLHLYRGSLAGLELVNRALGGYGDHAVGRANSFLVRAIFHQKVLNDSAQAALDLGQVLEIVDPKSSACEARLWIAAIHNLNYIYALRSTDLASLRSSLRLVRGVGKRLSKNEAYRRKLCIWTEALLLAPLGATRSAKRLLIKAKAWLFLNKYYHAGALCAVDLAILQLRDDEKQAAASTVDDLLQILAVAGPATAVYLEFWLHRHLPLDLLERQLLSYREEIVPLGMRGAGMFQPFTTIIGATSSPSPFG